MLIFIAFALHYSNDKHVVLSITIEQTNNKQQLTPVIIVKICKNLLHQKTGRVLAYRLGLKGLG